MMALVAAAVAAIAGCAQPPVPRDLFYRVDAGPPDGAFTTPPLRGAVMVERFRADGLVSQRPVVYSDSAHPFELLQYDYHYWVESPTVMMAYALTDYLRAAGAAATVDGPDIRSAAGCHINGNIRRFERVVGEDSSVASVALEIRLTRRNDDAELLLDTYRADMRAGDQRMTSVVVAFNAGLRHVFDQFLDALAASPADCPPVAQ
jgi:ABC-type uncharacterized transport system auxiliary subunit